MTNTTPPARKRGGKGLHRRKFLGGMIGAGAALAGATTIASTFLNTSGSPRVGAATSTLTVPDLLEGTTSDGTTTFTLEAQTGTAEVLSGVSSTTVGYNQAFLGPTMK